MKIVAYPLGFPGNRKSDISVSAPPVVKTLEDYFA